MKVYERAEVRDLVRDWVADKFKNQAEAARYCGVTPSEMSRACINTDSTVSSKILEAVGLERIAVYASDVPDEVR